MSDQHTLYINLMVAIPMFKIPINNHIYCPTQKSVCYNTATRSGPLCEPLYYIMSYYIKPSDPFDMQNLMDGTFKLSWYLKGTQHFILGGNNEDSFQLLSINMMKIN